MRSCQMTYGSSIFTSWFQLICGSQRSQLEFVLWWCGDVFKSDRSSRCYDPDCGKLAKGGGQGMPVLPGLLGLLSFVLFNSDKTKSDNAGHLLVVNTLFYILFSYLPLLWFLVNIFFPCVLRQCSLAGLGPDCQSLCI